MADDCKASRPLDYYRKFLEQDVRPDNRTLEEFRPTVLNMGCVGTAEGSALVKLGNTTVMCGIKAEIAAPKTEAPRKGFIVPNLELGPLCSPMFRPGPPGEQAQEQSHFLNQVILQSNCIDLESLCIAPGKHVWVLYCDLVCLNYDGNITDASIMAMVAAFRNVSLPTVTWDEESETLNTVTQQTISLNMQDPPVSTTFSIFDNTLLLVDPTVEEENLSTGEITIVTAGERLCIVRKPGGSAVTPAQLTMCFDRAFLRSQQALRLIDDTVHNVDR